VRSATYVLAALVAGFVLGSIAAATSSPAALRLVAIIEPLGTLWVNAIRMTVVPLVVAVLITGVVTGLGSRSLGRLGARALVTFAILLVAGGLIALVVAPPLLARLPLTPEVAARLQASATSAAASTVTSVQQLPTLAQRIVETIPANPIRSAADGAMLPLVIFTLVMALAIARLAPPLRESIVGFFSGVSDAMLVIVGWVLAAAPVGVFALSLSVAARTGIQAAGALLFYIVVLSLTLLLVTVMLYVAVLLFGRVSLRAFAVAALPAQAVAMSSRSSLAALPAMLRETRDRLGLSPVATSFVLPLAVSVLRMNVPPRWVISAVFLGQLYGVTVGFTSLVWVLVTAVLISFSVPGIPSASLFMLAPVLVSLGLPAEGVGLLIAVDTIPDMFNTLANVTGHMASTAIVAHDDREEALGARLEQMTARGGPITVGTPP
jgi:proton glutamate symport protein